MNWLKRIFRLFINPRARFDSINPSIVTTHAPEAELNSKRRRINLKDILFNLPLVLGSLIVLSLFVLVLYGPVWAPQNPYITGQHIIPHFDKELDEFIRPPLPPSPEYPLGTNRWGTDLLSLLMHGARNTLIAAVLITLFRVILGTILGGLAGWNEGKSIDRVVMSLIGVTTSIPMLISSMILIYALDIRRGLPVFLIALTIIGWTEIAQYVRSEFLVLRKMPYIEGAHAIGARDLAIAIRHCVPNIMPQLLVISFLEMGAVLMLLGELGFIGVYIGGGHQIAIFELMAPTKYFTLSEVPEWGAMLAEGYRWLRSKPFVVVPPAAALFISIIGFNSLGEGFRQLIEKHSINTAFLLRKRMLVIIAGVVLASVLIINNTGATPWYTKVAESFNSAAAYEHISTLSNMEGRGLNQKGGMEAADYIETKFVEYGLQPGWDKKSYRYLVNARRVEPIDQPVLNLLDENGNIIQEFRHQLDFGFVTEGHGGSGNVTLPLTYIGFTSDVLPGWQALAGLDLRDRIIILQKDGVPGDFASEAMLHGAKGVLWITGEGRDDVRSQYLWVNVDEDYLHTPNIPIFRIRPGTASQLLSQAGASIESLTAEDTEFTQSGDGWFSKDLDATVQMALTLSEPEQVEIPCILGYRSGYDLGLASNLLVLFTTYDGLGTDPDGTVFPGANHSASGIGIMLEIANIWNEQALDPRRSILFVAWPGQLESEIAKEFFESRSNFSHLITSNPYDTVAPDMIIQLDYAGAGNDELLIHPGSSPRLANLIEETAQMTEISIESRVDTPDFSADIITRKYEWMSIRWSDAQTSPLEDTLEYIDLEKVESIGRILSLTLINLVREADY
jgi:ABC-type dipeptide/oligopeptide/nickel transport system permease subunit